MSCYDFRSYSELYHHGILGMHWGIRRFQNKDGTLTGAGRKRYDISYGRDASGDKVLNREDILNVKNGFKMYLTEKRRDYYIDKYLKDSVRGNDEEAKKDFDEAYKADEMKSRYGDNCPNCALATEFKKRGIDVSPKRTGGLSGNQVHELYVGEKTKKVNTNSDFFNPKNYGKPGDHGQIMGAYPSSIGGGGHTLNYTVLPNGKVQIEDAQVGICCSLEEYRRLGYSMSLFEYGEILNLTQAEIDMDWARKMDMVTPQASSQENLKKYEKDAKLYVKGIKTLETFKSMITKGPIKTWLKKLVDGVKVGFNKKPSK